MLKEFYGLFQPYHWKRILMDDVDRNVFIIMIVFVECGGMLNGIWMYGNVLVRMRAK